MEASKLSAKRGKKLVDFVPVNLCVEVVVLAKESDRNYVMFACVCVRAVSTYTHTTCRFSKTSCSLYENIRKCTTALRS
jgi:hypothetical protein